MKFFLDPPRGHNLSMKKTTFWVLKGALKVDLLFVVCYYYTDRVKKTFSIEPLNNLI